MIKRNDNHHNYNHNNNNDSYTLWVCFSIKEFEDFFSKAGFIVLEGVFFVHAHITPFKIFLCFGKYAPDNFSNQEAVDQIWKTFEIPVKWRH